MAHQELLEGGKCLLFALEDRDFKRKKEAKSSLSAEGGGVQGRSAGGHGEDEEDDNGSGEPEQPPKPDVVLGRGYECGQRGFQRSHSFTGSLVAPATRRDAEYGLLAAASIPVEFFQIKKEARSSGLFAVFYDIFWLIFCFN